MTWPRSLATRLFLLTSLWAVLSVALIAWTIASNYRQTAEDRLAERLTANLYNIMGSIQRGQDGRLSGNPDLRDSRYLGFNSGYYWQVTQIGRPENSIRSVSLSGGDIPAGSGEAFDEDFQRRYSALDAGGNRLVGIEAQVFLGEGDDLFSFRITGNRSEVEKEVTQFVRNLLVLLAIFAGGFILATYFIVRFALKPLGRITAGLADIREGRAHRLDGNYPLEIAPLVEETNSLIRSNNAVIERARTQVGNLAHSLKTPLAVLRNEASAASPRVRGIIEEQVSQMQSQVTSYLDRARIAARTGSVTSRTEVGPTLERLLRVMQKLNPAVKFKSTLPPLGAIFAGEQQDFEEMLGNLLENASRFAQSRVIVSVNTSMESGHFLLDIDDDGPGMTAAEMQLAVRRGTRIDESQPGSGLGLSIVRDIVSEYGGQMSLEASTQGGLRVRLRLPSATAKSR